MRCDDLRESIHLLALDLLEPAEERLVREHLDDGCLRCASELVAATEAVGLLPYALPAAEPSGMAKARLMSIVRQEPAPTSTVPRNRSAAVMLAALAASVVVGLATGFVMLSRQEHLVASYDTRNREMLATIARQQEEMAALTRQIQETKRSIQLVSSPLVKVVNLVGPADRSGQAVRVFWDPAGRSWQLYASNLPAPPAGSTYQLWVITDLGRKISAGTFDTRSEMAATGALVVPPDAGRVTLAAVTLEPEGGSLQPTTQPFLVGKI